MIKPPLPRLKDARAPPKCQPSPDGKGWVGAFEAMASPCEILVDGQISAQDCAHLIACAAHEAWRIEEKFSRYRTDNLVYRINHSNGEPVQLDRESAQLISYAFECYQLSAGLFDISAGPLRRVWRFDGSEQVPDSQLLASTLALVGLDKCRWQPPFFTLPKAAEIDLGGIGKEYAVDRVLQLLQQHSPPGVCFLVNFGGDLACHGPRQSGSPWVIGVQSTASHSPLQSASDAISLSRGAIATSGDTHRHLFFQGNKLSHVLNPLTGYPVSDTPQSVTVSAPSCTLAGMLATFAMLQGAGAEAFLAEQNVRCWVQRPGEGGPSWP